MNTFVKVFMIKTILFFHQLIFCFTLGFTLQKSVNFKKVMSFLFMETNMTLVTHFVKKYQKQHPSLGFQLHFYKLFMLLSVYFYHKHCDSKICRQKERERERERERECVCACVSHTHTHTHRYLCITYFVYWISYCLHKDQISTCWASCLYNKKGGQPCSKWTIKKRRSRAMIYLLKSLC